MTKIICSLWCVLLFSLIVSANVPAPFQGGYAGFEPRGLEDFEAVSERLLIDLSALENYDEYTKDNSVKLENTFEFENRAGEKTIELTLPFGKDYQIYLDDVNLSVNAGGASNPANTIWKIPEETFWTDGKKLNYRANNNQAQSVQIVIPRGRHTLKITQKLAPSSNVTGILTKYWQFAFVFLPPESRRNITKTEYEIKTPANWESVVTPETAGENGVFRGAIGGGTQPRALLITTKMPVPQTYRKLQTASDVFLGFVAFGFPLIALALCWFVFAKSKFWWLWGIAFTFSWTFLAVVAVYFSQFAAELTIPEVQQLNYGYGDLGSVLLIFFAAVAALVAGFPLWLGVWFAARKIRKIP